MPKFKPGQSGNPKGRPRGTATTAKLRALLEPHAKDLVKRAVELALKGDVTALRLCLERLVAPIKATDEPVELRGLKGTLTEQGAAVIQAVASSQVTPEQAATLLQALAAQAKIEEADKLEKRISELEKAVGV